MDKQKLKRQEKKKEQILDQEEDLIDKELKKQKKRDRILKNQSTVVDLEKERLQKLTGRLENKIISSSSRFVLLKHPSNRSF